MVILIDPKDINKNMGKGLYWVIGATMDGLFE
jgi:hypothetical protein